jgi:hypothetical protein
VECAQVEITEHQAGAFPGRAHNQCRHPQQPGDVMFRVHEYQLHMRVFGERGEWPGWRQFDEQAAGADIADARLPQAMRAGADQDAEIGGLAFVPAMFSAHAASLSMFSTCPVRAVGYSVAGDKRLAAPGTASDAVLPPDNTQ